MIKPGVKRLLQARPRLQKILLAGLLYGMLLPCAHALPDDENQPIEVYGEQGELDLDLGISYLYGTEEDPASVIQGSVVVSGLEIMVQRGDEGELLKVTAKGKPARYQHQPSTDRPIVYASGLDLTFDNVASLVTVDEEAQFNEGGTVITGRQVVYNLETRRVNFARSDDEQFRITIPPQARDAP